MFAGRYLWWMLIAIAIFLFFSMCFDYVTWATLAMTGCARIAGSCSPIILTMSGSVKPAGMFLAGGIILIVTFARIHYLSMSWIWALVVAVWFAASASSPMLLANGWTGQLRPQMVLESLPVAFLFLVAFCAYLAAAFEEKGVDPLGAWRPLRMALWLAAIYGTLTAIAETPAFAWMPGRFLGLPRLSATIAALQPLLAKALDLDTGSQMPAFVVLAVFVIGLAISLLPQDMADLRARLTAPFMHRGLRR
jgi:hypothetical protein